MEGTYPLPEAQLDRFFFKLLVKFPRIDEMETILDRTTESHTPRAEPMYEATTSWRCRAWPGGFPSPTTCGGTRSAW
jgi:MoxR-like ATPase